MGVDPPQLVLEFLTGSVRSCFSQQLRNLANLPRGGGGDPGVDPFVKGRGVEARSSALPLAVLGQEPVDDLAQPLGGYFLVDEENREDFFEVVGSVCEERRGR